jgi:hypothetical protein
LRRLGLLRLVSVERKERLADAIERSLAAVVPVPPLEVPAEVEHRLRQAYSADRAVLEGLLGNEPPWA